MSREIIEDTRRSSPGGVETIGDQQLVSFRKAEVMDIKRG
jgi:hypothetical protein